MSGAVKPAMTPNLTPRMIECLRWQALGKSAWATGKILGVSEYTVNFHVKKAMRLLGTESRVHAIARAAKYGLIDV